MTVELPEASQKSSDASHPPVAESIDWHRLITGLIRLAAVLVALGMIGNLVFLVIDSEAILPALSAVDPLLLFVGLCMVCVTFATNSTRVRMWSALFGLPLQKRQGVAAVALNEVGSAITPSAAGGGYFKVIYLSSLGMLPARAALVMLIGSLEDFVFVLLFIPTTIAVTRSWDNPHVVTAAQNFLDVAPIFLLIIAGGLAFGYLLRKPITHLIAKALPKKESSDHHASWTTQIRHGIRKFLSEFREAVGFVWKSGKATFALGATLASIGWICRYTSINLILAAFGISMDRLVAALLNWTVFTITNFIPTPGGSGGAELAFATVFDSLIPRELLPALLLTWRAVTFYMPLILAALYLVWIANTTRLIPPPASSTSK